MVASPDGFVLSKALCGRKKWVWQRGTHTTVRVVWKNTSKIQAKYKDSVSDLSRTQNAAVILTFR